MKNSTENMLRLLPSWMKMRQNPNGTQGGAFLDSVGSQTEDIFNLIEGILIMKHPAEDPYSTDIYGNYNLKIEGIDLIDIDFVYRVKILVEPSHT